MTNKNITLNVWKDHSEFAMAMQGEANSRFLTVNLVDDNGAIDLTDKKVYFVSKNPDGTLVFYNMTIDDAQNGIATLALTVQMSAVPGLLKDGEVHITSETEETLIAKKINIFIQSSLRAAVDEKILELNDMEELLSAIDDLQEHAENASNPHNVTAAQVSALPSSTKYGTSLEVSGRTLRLKDQDGTILNAVTTQDTTYSNATNNSNGLMSSADKTKLDGIAAGAEVNVQANWNQTSSSADDFIKNKPNIPSNLTDLSGTLPIAQGGTGAMEARAAQSNLGLMKRYENFSHLNLPNNYTIYDVFVAMENNSYIEYTPGSTTPYDSSLMPEAAGSLKLIKFSQYEGYAEFWKNRRYGNAGKWIGTLRDGYDFNWIKIYTSNETVPIANGGTGATTASAALTALGAQSATDNSLLTNSKTIVGAINEIYSMIQSNN